jgi:hypothetical protein
MYVGCLRSRLFCKGSSIHFGGYFCELGSRMIYITYKNMRQNVRGKNKEPIDKTI